MFVKKYYPTKRSQNNLDNFLSEFLTDFEKSFRRPANTGLFKNRPAVNILETDENFQIELAVPGLAKENIQIDVDKEVLKVSAKKITGKEEKKYTLREFNLAEFERTFTLPETVDNQAISAKFENGILVLTLAKKEEAKPIPPRTIAIL